MIVELWKGYLPWRDQRSHAEMQQMKQRFTPDILAQDLNPYLVRFTKHIGALK